MQPQSTATLASAVNMGDTLVFARVAWQELDHPPHPAATWILQVTVPTGDSAAGFGDDAWVGTTGTSFSLYRRPFVLHADALFSAPLPDDAGRKLRPAVSWTLAVEVPASFARNRVALLVEVAARHQAAGDLVELLFPDAGPPEYELVIGAALEVIATDKLQALVGWQRTLSGRSVDVIDTLVVTLVPLL